MSATVNQIEDRRHATSSRSARHVLPLNSPRSSAQPTTSFRSTHNVQPYATPSSTTHHVTFYTTLRHTSQPHDCSRLFTSVHASVPLTDSAQFLSPVVLSSAHRFCSVPLTDFAHLRSPNLLTSARELSRIQQRTLTYPATNTHASNEHSRPLNEHSSFQPQVSHSTCSRRKHNLLSFILLRSV